MTYIKIPFDKVDQIIAHDDNGNNIDNPKLMLEVEQWCYDNLKFQPILPQRKDHKKMAIFYLDQKMAMILWITRQLKVYISWHI